MIPGVLKSDSKPPKVSVLLTVYNGEDFLRQAIDSILWQTCTDFELIVVNDGSTDDSMLVLQSMTDPRLLVIDAEHKGLVAALNEGSAHCRGKYIARMDADDIAMPQRLKMQADYLDAHPDCAFCCSNIELIDAAGTVIGHQDQEDLPRPELEASLTGARRLLPIIHPTMMMRRDVLMALGYYRPYHLAEDRDLWLRAIDHYGFHRMQERLLKYRMLASSVSRARPTEQAVSGALAVVNHLVHAKAGVDMQCERPDLWLGALRELETGFAALSPSGVAAFRVGRNQMRAGRPLAGTLKLTSALVRHGPSAIPANFDKRLLALTRHVAEQMIARCRATEGAA